MTECCCRSALEEMDEVKKATVELEKVGLDEPGTATVELEKPCTPNALVAAVEKAGRPAKLAESNKPAIKDKPDEESLGPIKLVISGLTKSRWLEAPKIRSKGGAFEAGMSSTFRVESTKKLDALTMVRVSQDGTGERPGWCAAPICMLLPSRTDNCAGCARYLDRMSVSVDGTEGPVAQFFCRQWLDATKADGLTTRDLLPFRPPVQESLRPACLHEWTKLKQSIDAIDATGAKIEELLDEQETKLDGEVAADAGEPAEGEAEADEEDGDGDDEQPEPADGEEADAGEATSADAEPGSVAFRTAALIAARAKKARRLAEERRKARDSALTELRTATRVDMDSLRALRASADLVLAGAEPESTAPQPVDANADQRITIEEIMGALHQDRRGLRKMLDEWQNGEAEGADGLGLRSHSSVRKETLEKIEKLRGQLIDGLGTDALVAWFMEMDISAVVAAIQDQGQGAPPLTGTTLRQKVSGGGWNAIIGTHSRPSASSP